MDKTVGILGGGQLGRMLIEEANNLNIKVNILDAADSPAKQISYHATHINGSFKNPDDVRLLAARSDVLTIEIEHVDVGVLHELASKGHAIHPDPETIEMIQDKFLQKQYYERHGIATAKSLEVVGTGEDEVTAVAAIGDQLGFPLVLKARKDAYDGRGNAIIQRKDTSEIKEAISHLGGRALYAEQFCKFQCELAVMVVKVKEGTEVVWLESTLAYPVVETVHQDSICKLTYCPPRDASETIQRAANELARKAVAGFKGKGIYGVEMFLLDDGQLLVNEIAPRVHNSGHWTDSCRTSQFAAHLRSILDLPLTEEHLKADNPSIMLNILGGVTGEAHLELARASLPIPGASVHLYGKGKGRPGRKMGHITVTGSSMAEAEQRIAPLIALFDQIREQSKSGSKPSTSSPSAAAVPSSSSNIQAAEGVAKVAVIMGSDSDLDKLVAGIEILDKLQIPRRVDIKSAHRTADAMAEFSRVAEKKGYKVIIAAAGGAAHLPGMSAAFTHLPVIGVPIASSTDVNGDAAIASILRMPRGCPVASVSPNNSVNAALLAAKILSLEDPGLRARLEEFEKNQKQTVLKASNLLRELDYKEYLQQKKA